MSLEQNIKKIILLQIRMSICNLRCHYCYLAQRTESYQGEQVTPKYSPRQMAYAMRPERLGGYAFINVCADGETLLTKDLDMYLKPLAEAGHYLEIVSNMTITPMLEKILSWGKSALEHVEFKCSFHYLELKKRGLLDVFASNVGKARKAGASVCIEVTPSDELIPFVDELKKYSIGKFGALPHITIARDDRTDGIVNLTNLPDAEYEAAWTQFDSAFWKYKRSEFGRRQTGFCYAGLWSTTVDFETGEAQKCYYEPLGNLFEDPDAPWPESPIGKCPIAHCYNAHAFLTLGCIVHASDYARYGDIRDRACIDGTHWLQPRLKSFFNTRLWESNHEWTAREKHDFLKGKYPFAFRNIVHNALFHVPFGRKVYQWISPVRQWRGNVWPILRANLLHRKIAYLVLTPDHGNLGDHAIAKAAGNMLRESGIEYMEISMSHLQNLRSIGALNVFGGHPIFINGGGNIGTLWPEVEQMMEDVVRENPGSAITILPNTCLFSDTDTGRAALSQSREIFNGHGNLTIYAREKISYDFMKRNYVNVKLCPDLVLSLSEVGSDMGRAGCLLCLRSDKERSMSDEKAGEIAAEAEKLFPCSVVRVDTHLNRAVPLHGRDMALQAKFDEFRRVELVITDRLHGMVFAAITGTPCIVVNSRSHKVVGCYEWLKNLNYIKFCNDVSQIADLYRSIPVGDHCCDVAGLNEYFNELKSSLRI